ncbi:MAG: pyridoxamine 5'-phosphate oxidase family protein [Micropepsaceae bacterium]
MDASNDKHEHLYDLISDFGTAMLVTNAGANTMRARPMAVVELRPDADAYFMTSIESPKVGEIEHDSNVLLTFQSSSQFASVRGIARVDRDKALIKQHWKESWKVWFPKGVDDPSLALIRFEAHEGEYWDNAGVQGMKYAFEAVKAYMQGETPKTDDRQHGKVAL